MKPTSFGPYTLLQRLGKGGMSEVFLARSTNAAGLDRLLAIKRLLGPFNSDQQLTSMLADEARVSVWLTHPNIVQVFDFGKAEGLYYIALEYVEGADLCRLIRRKHNKVNRKEGVPLPLATALFVAWQIADALDYAHTRRKDDGTPLNIIHRDVSPHNVLISRDGQVKLADFGLARAAISLHHTHAGVIRGKFAYMPREQAHGQKIDHRIDVFAAGATLYEALTGIRPYSAQTLAQQLYQLEQPLAPPSAHMPDIAPEIDDLTMQAMHPAPEGRYQTAAELAHDLLHALNQLSTPKQEAQQLAALVQNTLGPAPPREEALITLTDMRPARESLIQAEVSQVRQATLIDSSSGTPAESGVDPSHRAAASRSVLMIPQEDSRRTAEPRQGPENEDAPTTRRPRSDPIVPMQPTAADAEEGRTAHWQQPRQSARSATLARTVPSRHSLVIAAGGTLLLVLGVVSGFSLSLLLDGDPTPAEFCAEPRSASAPLSSPLGTSPLQARRATPGPPVVAVARPHAAGRTDDTPSRDGGPAADARSITRVRFAPRKAPAPAKKRPGHKAVVITGTRRPRGEPHASTRPPQSSPRPTAKGFLSVLSPKRGIVLVDEARIGPTPVEQLRLDPGVYRVRVLYPGWTYSTTKWVTVEAGKPARLTFAEDPES